MNPIRLHDALRPKRSARLDKIGRGNPQFQNSHILVREDTGSTSRVNGNNLISVDAISIVCFHHHEYMRKRKQNPMKESQKRNLSSDKCLAYGEVTGHAHRVDVDVFINDENGTREYDGPTTIIHEEHKPIAIPAKKMASAQVLEFDHLSQMQNPVRD